MDTEKEENPLGCPVVSTLQIIGGKWKPMIIHLLSEKPLRFGEIKRAMSPISQKVLTQQLRDLETKHVIRRDVYEEKVLNVTYSLSEHGNTLAPVLESLYNWGDTHLPYANR